MIASVRGEVLDIALGHVVIEAAGVGYKVMATPSTLATLHRGGEARLITAMVTRILALQTKPTPADAADALALAICHCWRAPMIARMAAAEALAAEQQRKYKARLKAAR